VDAGVILAAFDSDDGLHETCKALLASEEFTLASLDLVRYEVANVAVRAWRAHARVAPLLSAVDRIAEDGGVLASTSVLLMGAAELAEEHSISVYDAAYVAAANQVGAALVSCDVRDLVGKGLAREPAGMLGK